MKTRCFRMFFELRETRDLLPMEIKEAEPMQSSILGKSCFALDLFTALKREETLLGFSALCIAGIFFKGEIVKYGFINNGH